MRGEGGGTYVDSREGGAVQCGSFLNIIFLCFLNFTALPPYLKYNDFLTEDASLWIKTLSHSRCDLI